MQATTVLASRAQKACHAELAFIHTSTKLQEINIPILRENYASSMSDPMSDAGALL